MVFGSGGGAAGLVFPQHFPIYFRARLRYVMISCDPAAELFRIPKTKAGGFFPFCGFFFFEDEMLLSPNKIGRASCWGRVFWSV